MNRTAPGLKDYQTLISCHFFHCSKKYFQNLIKELRSIIDFYHKEKTFNVSFQTKTIVLRKPESGEQILITLETSSSRKEDQYFQVDVPSFQIKMSGYVKKNTDFSNLFSEISRFVENESLVFSDLEQKKIEEYTPLLEHIVNQAHPKSKILKDFIVIFREHSLLSVFNVAKVLKNYGLTSQNLIFYGKGDRCRNLERIEATFRKMGHKVFTLSPLESVSTTGKTEDEKILPRSVIRLKKELLPIFKKAEREDKKIILFDDGGLLITAIIDKFPKYLNLITGAIETTKGGMNAIATRPDLPLPIINLADSNIKNYMGTVVAHSITHRLRDIIPQVRFLGETCVIVGYGVLGRPIAHDMRNLGLAVHVCEIDDIKILEAQSDGFPATKDVKRLFTKLHPRIVLGCTGLDALTYENLSLLPNECYVATVSSNEIKQSFPEFNKRWKLNCCDNYGRIYTSPEGKKLIILANGASLNLFNAEGAIHADYQPFLASMIVAILFLAKAVRKGKKLPNGLNTELANQIEEENKILENFVNFRPNY